MKNPRSKFVVALVNSLKDFNATYIMMLFSHYFILYKQKVWDHVDILN
jgi:hypothetical protein